MYGKIEEAKAPQLQMQKQQSSAADLTRQKSKKDEDFADMDFGVRGDL